MSTKKPDFVMPELSVKELSSALYEANKQLAETNRKLLESEQQRKELFANLSHDLKSPLTSIKTNVEYLQSLDTFDPVETYQSLDIINMKIDQMNHLMNELLMVSTLDSLNSSDINLESIPLSMFLEEYYCSCLVDSKFTHRKLEFSPHITDDVNVFMDPKLILRVLDNLYSNALKYSNEHDHICLELNVEKNRAIVSISDTGIGISTESITHIFNRSFTVSKSRTHSSSSSFGLGLSIVASIITLHNGAVWCESDFGSGSTFYFSLPI